MPNPYETLGVPVGASLADIKKATAGWIETDIRSVGDFLKLCETRVTIANNMHAFMHHPKTRIVKDIVAACEFKQAL